MTFLSNSSIGRAELSWVRCDVYIFFTALQKCGFVSLARGRPARGTGGRAHFDVCRLFPRPVGT